MPLGLKIFSIRGIVISAVSNTLEPWPPTASPTPVLKLYLPVKMPALVGEHNGLDHALLNTIPFAKRRLILGNLTVSR